LDPPIKSGDDESVFYGLKAIYSTTPKQTQSEKEKSKKQSLTLISNHFSGPIPPPINDFS
jgi:hypothetical protein